MNESLDMQSSLQSETLPNSSEELVMDPTKMDSAVLARLVEEVKVEGENRLSAYNRTHNRHNRGR
jgi:hypothetical protein